MGRIVTSSEKAYRNVTTDIRIAWMLCWQPFVIYLPATELLLRSDPSEIFGAAAELGEMPSEQSKELCKSSLGSSMCS